MPTELTKKPQLKVKKKTKVKAQTKPPRTNPNGANQYVFDPRQKLCWELYINPDSPTFSNATKSAIKAGYTPNTADRITTEEWFQGKLRRLNMLHKAERVLEETLTMSDKVKMVANGIILDLERQDPMLTKIKQDTAKFLAERLGKNDGYSTRNEITGPDGKPFIPIDKDAKDASDAAINQFLNHGRNPSHPPKSK